MLIKKVKSLCKFIFKCLTFKSFHKGLNGQLTSLIELLIYLETLVHVDQAALKLVVCTVKDGLKLTMFLPLLF